MSIRTLRHRILQDLRAFLQTIAGTLYKRATGYNNQAMLRAMPTRH